MGPVRKPFPPILRQSEVRCEHELLSREEKRRERGAVVNPRGKRRPHRMAPDSHHVMQLTERRAVFGRACEFFFKKNEYMEY